MFCVAELERKAGWLCVRWVVTSNGRDSQQRERNHITVTLVLRRIRKSLEREFLEVFVDGNQHTVIPGFFIVRMIGKQLANVHDRSFHYPMCDFS